MTLYVVGAGGAGRETYDAALAGDVEVAGFLDDALAGQTIRGLPVLAPSEVRSGEYVIGIANPAARARLADQLAAQGLAAVSVLHPRAVIGPDTTIGAGCVVLANAHVSSSIVLSDHCQVHYNATVGHDAWLGERSTVYPGANVGGAVHLDADTTVGSNAVVLQGLTIGAGAFIGAGAVVTRDVAPGVVVVGSPARPMASPMSPLS